MTGRIVASVAGRKVAGGVCGCWDGCCISAQSRTAVPQHHSSCSPHSSSLLSWSLVWGDGAGAARPPPPAAAGLGGPAAGHLGGAAGGAGPLPGQTRPLPHHQHPHSLAQAHTPLISPGDCDLQKQTIRRTVFLATRSSSSTVFWCHGPCWGIFFFF